MTASDSMEDKKNNNVAALVDHDNSGSSYCDGHQHFPIDVLDQVINIRIDEMFTHLFSDSPFFREFTRRRKTFDLHLPDWSETPDEHGMRTRVLRYTLSINYSIGPKTSASVETQRMHSMSKPGSFYLIDSDCSNGGVPYADDFYTSVRYCMTRVSATATRLRISSKVVYKKHMWGLMKNFIDKTANAGLKESFGLMVTLLKMLSEGRLHYPSQEQLHNDDSPVSRPRVGGHHRSNESLAGGDALPGAPDPCHRPQPPPRHKRRAYASKMQYNSNVTDILAGVLFIIVLILVFVHIAFYVQLSALEETVSKALAVKDSCV